MSRQNNVDDVDAKERSGTGHGSSNGTSHKGHGHGGGHGSGHGNEAHKVNPDAWRSDNNNDKVCKADICYEGNKMAGDCDTDDCGACTECPAFADIVKDSPPKK